MCVRFGRSTGSSVPFIVIGRKRTTLRKLMFRRVSRAIVTPAVGVRSLHSPIVETIGKGRIIPLRLETLRPVYVPRTFMSQVITFGPWMILNQLPSFIIGFTLLFAAHGGFTGHLPPDPHMLHP